MVGFNNFQRRLFIAIGFGKPFYFILKDIGEAFDKDEG